MSAPSNYAAAEEVLKELGYFRINPSIENISRFLNQEKLFPEFDLIQVSGTNGKTSTSVFLASLIASTGKKTGLYISPHVLQFGERLSISGRSLSPEEFGESFMDFYLRYRNRIQENNLTQFEVLTAYAVWYFNRSGVEFAVFETGLGGRFDAVSALNAPCGVLTGVHFDHTELLGNTIESIAYEKLYPFTGKTVYMLDSALNDDIKKVAERLNVNLQIFEASEIESGFDRTGTTVYSPFKARLRLIGGKYAENALLSLRVSEALGFAPEISVLENSAIPARFQIVRGWGSLFVMDGSHNPQAVNIFLNTFKEVFEGEKFAVICGFMKDKDYEFMLDLISEAGPEKVFLVEVKSAGERSAALYGYQNELMKYEQSLETAVSSALSYTDLIAVTGSLYLCGDFIKTFAPELGYEAFNYYSDAAFKYF